VSDFSKSVPSLTTSEEGLKMLNIHLETTREAIFLLKPEKKIFCLDGPSIRYDS
jgi:hypothetical protein